MKITWAISDGHLDVIEKYLAHHSPDEVLENKSTLLTWATRAGQLAVVDLLLRHGADPDKPDEACHCSPLFWAAKKGPVSVVERLLDGGASIDLRNGHDNETALATAVEGDSEENLAVVRLLIERGAAEQVRSDADVLIWACTFSSPAIVGLLLDHGAPVNGVTERGTPLAAAVAKGRADLVELLLQRGADPALPTAPDTGDEEIAGKTPLQIARERRAVRILKLLGDPGPKAREKGKRAPSISRSWQRLNAALVAHPELLASLRTPAEAGEIRKLADALGRPVPDDLAESLAVHDGQRSRAPLLAPAGGGEPVFQLLRVAEIAGHRSLVPSISVSGQLVQGEPQAGDDLLVPFATDGAGNYLCLRVGKTGQVLLYDHEKQQSIVEMASSYADWLADLAEYYETEAQ
jgi:ankyrin repeat protein/cell wall assembly regulator SMI1